MRLTEIYDTYRYYPGFAHLRGQSSFVPGRGQTVNAKVMLIGEAPGKREDLMQKPFVGASGKLLDELLETAKLSEEETYITNVVKYRPFNRWGQNRTPTNSEILDSIPFLWQEWEAIGKPPWLITLGAVATGAVGIHGGSILEFAGDRFPRTDHTVIPMVHPSYIVRNPMIKARFLEEWEELRDIIS